MKLKQQAQVLFIAALYKGATSVTCECGQELKTEKANVARLTRLGCPVCHSKKWQFHGLPDEAAQLTQLRGVTPVEG